MGFFKNLFGGEEKPTENRETVEELIARLNNIDSFVRYETIEVLAKFDDARVAEAIFAVYSDHKESQGSHSLLVKPVAAATLAKMGDPRAAECLISLLQNEMYYDSTTVIDALGTLGDIRAVKPLANLLFLEDIEYASFRWRHSESSFLGAPCFEVRQHVIYALYNIGDVSAVDPLINSMDKFPIPNIESEEDREQVGGAKRKARDATLMTLLHLDMDNPKIQELAANYRNEIFEWELEHRDIEGVRYTFGGFPSEEAMKRKDL